MEGGDTLCRRVAVMRIRSKGAGRLRVLIWGILFLAVVASPILGQSASSGSESASKATAEELKKKGEIYFSYAPIDFRLDSSETPERHAPETMAGGVAVFDYNNDGALDVFFTNG